MTSSQTPALVDVAPVASAGAGLDPSLSATTDGPAGVGRGSPRQPGQQLLSVICRCGYSTSVTRPAFAQMGLDRHSCAKRTRGLLYDVHGLPAEVYAALEHYARTKGQRRAVRVDAVAVCRAVAGTSVIVNPHERFAAYVWLRLHRLPESHIAARLRLSWARQRTFRLIYAAGLEGATA